MGKTYVVSDLHLLHFNIIRYTHRPFTTAEEMNDYIIKQWNATVGDDDIVINLGDLGFGFHKEENKALRERVKNLNGKEKILIKGNHDKRKAQEYRDMGFTFEEKSIIRDTGTEFGRILFSHRPEDLRKYRGLAQWNLFGHLHNNPLENCEPELLALLTDKHFIFILENTDYKPLSLEDFMNTRELRRVIIKN